MDRHLFMRSRSVLTITLVTMIVTIMVTVYGNPGDFCAIVVFLIHNDNGSESVACSIDDHVEVELQCLVVNI